MDWSMIVGVVITIVVYCIWFVIYIEDRRRNQIEKDEHIEWTGDNICLRRKHYPDGEMRTNNGPIKTNMKKRIQDEKNNDRGEV